MSKMRNFMYCDQCGKLKGVENYEDKNLCDDCAASNGLIELLTDEELEILLSEEEST